MDDRQAHHATLSHHSAPVDRTYFGAPDSHGNSMRKKTFTAWAKLQRSGYVWGGPWPWSNWVETRSHHCCLHGADSSRSPLTSITSSRIVLNISLSGTFEASRLEHRILSLVACVAGALGTNTEQDHEPPT